uniref:Rps6-2 n=1 Tax=Arundo donax TaxID=35708 RepID=A0A0A8XQP8_ARUDO
MSVVMLWAEFKGYVCKIIWGCDKRGFPIKQRVLTSGRERLLLHRGTPCFRWYGRDGECRLYGHHTGGTEARRRAESRRAAPRPGQHGRRCHRR